MKLKLFRQTEFAESSLFAPTRQRFSTHPGWVSFFASLWLAIACNAALWQELVRISHLSQLAPLWSAALLTGLMTAISFTVFSIFSSRRLLKPLIILLFFLAAICCHLMLNEHIVLDVELVNRALNNNPLTWQLLANWKLWLTLFVLAFIPTLMLLNTPVRRLAPHTYLMQNGAMAAISAVVVLIFLVLSMRSGLSDLIKSQPQLMQMANPFGPLQVLNEVFKQHSPF